MYLVYALTVIILGSWAVKSILAGRFVFRRSFLDIPLILFLLSLSLSTITSIDVHTSIFGYYSRLNGGLLSSFAYCLLYWAFVSNITCEKVRNIIILLLISATTVSIYAILEHFGISISCILLKGQFSANCWVQNVQERVFATLGQPNWLAAFLATVFPLSLLSLTSSPTIKNFVIPLLLALAIFYTKSRSGFLGVGVGAAIFASFLLRKSWLLFAAVFLSGFILWNHVFADCFDLNPSTLSKQATESCKIRTIVWRGAIDIWKANPILGTGPETFAYSYYQHRPVEHNLTSEWELLYNKAHNEYINYLANTGVVGLGSYLIIILSFILWMLQKLKTQSAKVKTTTKDLKLFALNYRFEPCTLHFALLAGYTSILVTNFFGFSVVTTNLLFFLYPGVAVAMQNIKQKTESIKTEVSIKKFLIIIFALCAMLYALSRLAGFWYADTLYSQASDLNREWQAQQAIKLLNSAISLNPWEPRYYNELSDSFSILEDAYLSKAYSDKALTISPYNLTFWNTRAVNFKRLAGIDVQYLDLAIDALENAIKLAPTEPKIHYNLGVLYDYAGKKQKAKQMIEKALELKPNYNDAKEALEKLKM